MLCQLAAMAVRKLVQRGGKLRAHWIGPSNSFFPDSGASRSGAEDAERGGSFINFTVPLDGAVLFRKELATKEPEGSLRVVCLLDGGSISALACVSLVEMATTVVVAPLGLSCRSNPALATTSAHQSACPAAQLCAVKPYGPQSTSRSSSSLTIGSGLRVGRSLEQIGSVRHEYSYHELVASVVAHSRDGGSAGGALASEMNIFTRIARIVRSYVEQFVGSGEDPERIIDQAVEEMTTDLVKLRQTSAQVVAAKRILENKYNTAQQASDEWYKRAARALERGDEALAKEALKRRKAFSDNAKSLKSQLDQQVVVSERILSSTRILESKIYEARNKKDLLKARAQGAKTTKEVNEILGSVDATSALSAYKRMEEKVERLEAEADAVTQMAYDDLGSKFAQLETDVDVDDDLKSLKKDLLGSSSTTTAQLRGELPPWEREAIRAERTREPDSYRQF